jgi:hypothetical protein
VCFAGRSRECPDPECRTEVRPTSFVPELPDSWVRPREGGWWFSESGPRPERERPMRGAYRCPSCGRSFRVIETA